MMKFSLEKAEKPTNEEMQAVIAALNSTEFAGLRSFVQSVNEPRYVYWDDVKHKRPLPPGIKPHQAWEVVKLYRRLDRRGSPVRAEDGSVFEWVKLEKFERSCHEFDLHAGGELVASIKDLSHEQTKMMVSKGLIDEAIASAQLEGADTSRVYAQKMLREKIKPKTPSEQMIMNNHKALLEVERRFSKEPLSVALIEEMHSILIEKTLDDSGETPKLRVDEGALYVRDDRTVYHVAPKPAFAAKELERLVDFANGSEEKGFVHPVIKGAILHFWIGYLHPFTDGNGRLARLLFLWYVLRKEYWAFSYMPIATKIKDGGKKQYTMAYVYAEQDEYDLTYFIDFIVRKIEEAHREFKEYVTKTKEESRGMVKIAREKFGLNDRQVQVVKYLSGVQGATTSIVAHMSTFLVSRITATKDLEQMVGKGLLTRRKSGKIIHYFGSGLKEGLT